MTSNLEERLYRLEASNAAFQQQVASLLGQIAALKQQTYVGSGGYGGGGSGGAVTFLFATTSADLPANSNITSQTVTTLNSGTPFTLTTTATIYNVTGSDIPSASKVFLGLCQDGTYGVIGVACVA